MRSALACAHDALVRVRLCWQPTDPYMHAAHATNTCMHACLASSRNTHAHERSQTRARPSHVHTGRGLFLTNSFFYKYVFLRVSSTSMEVWYLLSLFSVFDLRLQRPLTALWVSGLVGSYADSTPMLWPVAKVLDSPSSATLSPIYINNAQLFLCVLPRACGSLGSTYRSLHGYKRGTWTWT